MSGIERDGSAMLEAAGDWLARRQDESWTAADEQAFQAWLRADAAHEQAFGKVSRIWDQLDRTEAARVRSQKTTRPKAWRGAAPGRLARRHAGWLASGLAVALCLAVVLWWPADHPGALYELQRETVWNETDRLDLPDGSLIELNRNSALQLAFDGRTRSVGLTRGEAFFSVAPDAGQPFVVKTAQADVTVVGTAFNVAQREGWMRVDVQHGKVSVRPAGHAGEPFLLEAGQSLRVERDGRVSHQVSTESGSWRQGRIVFRGTPLGEVAATLSAYRTARVVVADAATARLSISGVAHTQNPDAFIRSLPLLTGISVTPMPDGGVRLARQP